MRFSSDGQSNSSIERQEIITENWRTNNNVDDVCIPFKDLGQSARNFDRPDVEELFKFIKSNRGIDYLIVSDLTRFSRELGEAVTMVKYIQDNYKIKIVSAGRNAIYDVNDHASYFMLSLEFLMGNTENIKRINDINGGIYAAKKREGRFLAKAPLGYKNVKLENGKPGIAPDENKVHIIHYIFNSFIKGMPQEEIKRTAVKMGFNLKAKAAIARILTNKVYIGLLHVKAFKDFPEEWVQGVHEPLINTTTFEAAQILLRKRNPVKTIDDELPLRGVLKCWCNRPLTGSPSFNKLKKPYNYYKCQTSSHNNISAIKAHAQLSEVWKYLSLPERMINSVHEQSANKFKQQLKENNKLLNLKQSALKDVIKQVESMEEKYIRNEIAFDTYQRWHTKFNDQRSQIKQEMEFLQKDENGIYSLLETQIEKLSDLNYRYEKTSTINKQQLIKLVFDSQLYYQQGIYRTPYIISFLSHNHLILREKQLLLIDEKALKMKKVPSGRPDVTSIEPLIHLLEFIRSMSA